VYKRTILASAVLVFVSACANRPESISASYVSHEKYMDGDCVALNTQMSNARAELSKVSDMQNSKATGDAWGVFLLGVPFSKLSGDHEADVAKWKGEVGAIETAQIKHKCMVAGEQKKLSNDKDAQPQVQAQAAQPASGKN
jgi:hypothetical protein